MQIINKKIDFFFIQFPIIFPLIYFLILYFIPSLEIYLIAFTLLVLAEPHFGATWPIFLDKQNRYQIKKNKFTLILGPILIIFFSLAGFFLFQHLFLLIFYAFNVHHVTKQSAGIIKLYSKNDSEKKYQINLIYFINIIFFFVGLLRFYVPIINNNNLIFLSTISILILTSIAIIQYLKFKSFSNSLITMTGMLIFYPKCFVLNPVHAIILGVTMHYSQYIVITGKVFFGRKNLSAQIKKSFLEVNAKFIIFIMIYGLIMTIFASLGKLGTDLFKNLIIIPIIGQMLHFYIDGFIWKFSDKHNRDITLRHIFNI